MIDYFKIISVSEYNSRADFSTFLNFNEEELNDITYSLNIAFETANTNHLHSIVTIVIHHVVDAEEVFVLDFSVLNSFEVLDDDFFQMFKDEELKELPVEVIRLVFNTSIGNTRGMLVNRLSSTPIDLVLPLVNVEGMIKDVKGI